MTTYRDTEILNTLQISKQTFKDLGSFLSDNDLLDDRKLWFAGYDNYRKASNNAVAENLLYGNKRLKIVCIKDNEVFFISNSKEGLNIRLLGHTEENFKMTSLKILLHPTVNITSPQGLLFEFKVTKNKRILKDFKKILKN